MSNDKLKIKKLHTLSSENRQFSFALPLKHTIRIGKRDYEVKLKADEKFGTYILKINRYQKTEQRNYLNCKVMSGGLQK